MSCSFNPPSNGRFRPPLSKKPFPVHRVEKKNASREVRFSFFFPNIFFPFLVGGGDTVFRKYSHLFNVSNKQLLRP